MQEIIDAVTAEPEFREQGQDRAARGAFPKGLQGFLGVRGGIREPYARRAETCAHETVAVR